MGCHMTSPDETGIAPKMSRSSRSTGRSRISCCFRRVRFTPCDGSGTIPGYCPFAIRNVPVGRARPGAYRSHRRYRRGAPGAFTGPSGRRRLPNACCARSQPGSSAPHRTVSRTRNKSPGATAQDEPLGAVCRRAAELPGKVTQAFDFIGRSASAFPKAIVSPRSVDWRSLPRLLEEMGANAVLVTTAANMLVGLIIGFLGVSQLKRFGSIVYVPELVVVAQFRELGPLVTAIVVAGRSAPVLRRNWQR